MNYYNNTNLGPSASNFPPNISPSKAVNPPNNGPRDPNLSRMIAAGIATVDHGHHVRPRNLSFLQQPGSSASANENPLFFPYHILSEDDEEANPGPHEGVQFQNPVGENPCIKAPGLEQERDDFFYTYFPNYNYLKAFIAYKIRVVTNYDNKNINPNLLEFSVPINLKISEDLKEKDKINCNFEGIEIRTIESTEKKVVLRILDSNSKREINLVYLRYYGPEGEGQRNERIKSGYYQAQIIWNYYKLKKFNEFIFDNYSQNFHTYFLPPFIKEQFTSRSVITHIKRFKEYFLKTLAQSKAQAYSNRSNETALNREPEPASGTKRKRGKISTADTFSEKSLSEPEVYLNEAGGQNAEALSLTAPTHPNPNQISMNIPGLEFDNLKSFPSTSYTLEEALFELQKKDLDDIEKLLENFDNQ